MAAWGIEARVPFLDREFLDVAMGFDPEEKMVKDGRIEKHALRQAFEGYLPDEILWRQKEQFSDGVGYSWIDSLKEHAEREVERRPAGAGAVPLRGQPAGDQGGLPLPLDLRVPLPRRARRRAAFPRGRASPARTPTAIAWDEAWAGQADPSGRAVRGVHKEALPDATAAAGD